MLFYFRLSFHRILDAIDLGKVVTDHFYFGPIFTLWLWLDFRIKVFEVKICEYQQFFMNTML